MAKKAKNKEAAKKSVETLVHGEAKRKIIPTAEMEPVVQERDSAPIPVTYKRGTKSLEEEKANRDRDLDPQLVWRGKDVLDQSALVATAPPIYIQEKIHPKALIDDLRQETEKNGYHAQPQLRLFDDFNGIPDGVDRTGFYRHDQNWSNRMILGDSLHVMASLAEREGLRDKVQCIYIDPPYGIKFNSNFQWSTTSRGVKDGDAKHITREPEQVKAFRDTWRDGIHSYLSYLRDRLTAARGLLTGSGSIFVQIGDENVHRVRCLMDEVFGEENFVALITYAKTTGFSGNYLSSISDYLIWYSKSYPSLKYHNIFGMKEAGAGGAQKYREVSAITALHDSVFDPTRLMTSDQLTSQGASSQTDQVFEFQNRKWTPPGGLHWKTPPGGLQRLARAGRVIWEGNSIRYVRFMDDFTIYPKTNIWFDIGGVQSRIDPKIYVVQTAAETLKRCILMTTDPGDLVLDPTCGSGTTAYVAEQWGRRWIAVDTSRVALALARARIMGARYPYYILKDSPEGREKEAEITGKAVSAMPAYGKLRQGFVYGRVPHVTLKSIANNAEIDEIWDKWQKSLEPLREKLNRALKKEWQEWEIPREAEDRWPDGAKKLHSEHRRRRIARQKEMDASIARHAEFEYLYDKPYAENKKVRVAGPFTVESLSPHRMIEVDENDGMLDPRGEIFDVRANAQSFVNMIIDNLKTAGVQQAHKDEKIDFVSLTPWPGKVLSAEGRYIEKKTESKTERRAGIFIGPEFGTARRADLAEAAREAAEAGFDVLISCAFGYEAHSADFDRLGKIPVLKARMNADLHMSEDLKNTGKGNLFIIFGEPDVEILTAGDGKIQVKVKGVDIFDPNTGEVRSNDIHEIACWFVDTDYNEESFFVRQAYFLGANDPYKALKTTLKAEINEEAWATLHSAVSRPFGRPASGRIAVKVINHLGDEVMKAYRV